MQTERVLPRWVMMHMEFFAHNTGGTSSTPNTGGVKASNSGTVAVASDSYGVYALNEGGVIDTTDIHGVWAENTNADSDTSVRAENDGSGAEYYHNG